MRSRASFLPARFLFTALKFLAPLTAVAATPALATGKADTEMLASFDRNPSP
jgi:hypothetical protein